MSPGGNGASGRSNNSLPCSSRKVLSSGLISSMGCLSCILPDQVWTSLTVAGPNAARYLSTRSRGSSEPGGDLPSHFSAVVKGAFPEYPHVPPEGSCTSGRWVLTAYASAD